MAPQVANKALFSRTRIYHISNSDIVKNENEIESDVYNADFETAMSATKFGKFNVFLLLLAIPAGWTSMFETTSMSFVFPAAHCDLDLSLNQRGSLNAITFVGMITSGFIWGYLCDTLGRKKLMVVGYLLDSVFVILSSFAQNYTFLLVTKFFGGLIVNGPFAALMAYLSEFHCSKYRSRVQLTRGLIMSCGSLALPMLAWAVLPHRINIELFNNGLVLHSWNFFLLLCAVPSLISGIAFIFMPESPKFLMTAGRNIDALEVFKLVYSLNTGRSKDEFPIKGLMNEVAGNEKHEPKVPTEKKKHTFKEALNHIKPLCSPPHVKFVIIVCSIRFLYTLSRGTLNLWLPQIFQSISDYEYYNNGTSSSLCTMLSTLRPSTEKNQTCHVNFSPSVYFNSMTIAAVSICGYIVAGTLVNALGKKTLFCSFAAVSGIGGMSIYFAQDRTTTVALSAVFLALGGICGNVIITIVIELFPTYLRTFTISLVMMLGRSASIFGNLIFPLLLTLGCAPTFFSVGTIVIVCSLLAIPLPSTEQKSLK